MSLRLMHTFALTINESSDFRPTGIKGLLSLSLFAGDVLLFYIRLAARLTDCYCFFIISDYLHRIKRLFQGIIIALE